MFEGEVEFGGDITFTGGTAVLNGARVSAAAKVGFGGRINFENDMVLLSANTVLDASGGTSERAGEVAIASPASILDVSVAPLDASFLDKNGNVQDQYTIIKGPIPAAPVAGFSGVPIAGRVP